MKSDRKREYARQMEYRGKRVYGQRPKWRDREIIFKPWSLILKRRKRKRKYGIEVNA